MTTDSWGRFTVSDNCEPQLRPTIDTGKQIGLIMAIFGLFMGDVCLDNRFESFLEVICFRLVLQNPDFIIVKTTISKFHDLWILEPVEPHIYAF